MNLKYYLRGLGIGIVVAAVLMGVATKGNAPMTDAEIKERAAQLGMVEQKVLADITNAEKTEGAEATTDVQDNFSATPQPETTETPAEPTEAPVEPTETPAEPTETPVEPTETPAEPTEAPAEPTEAPPEPTQVPQSGNEETIHLIIRSGESSWTVSKNLVQLGIIDDAGAFDRYLSKEGFDKTIRVGEYDIMPGASYEEIAKIIAK